MFTVVAIVPLNVQKVVVAIEGAVIAIAEKTEAIAVIATEAIAKMVSAINMGVVLTIMAKGNTVAIKILKE